MIITALITILKNEPTISAIFGDRIFSGSLPDAPDYPALWVHKITGIGTYSMGGDANLEDARVQIDVLTDLGMEQVEIGAQAVRRFLSGYKGGVQETGQPCTIDACMCINSFDQTEPSTERAGPRVRRRILEFRVWNTEV